MYVKAMTSVIRLRRSAFVAGAPLMPEGIFIVSMHHTAQRSQAVVSRLRYQM